MTDEEVAAWCAEHTETHRTAWQWLELLMETGLFAVVDWQLRLALLQFAGDLSRQQAIGALQRLVDVETTGVLCPSTVRAVNRQNVTWLRGAVLAAQLEIYSQFGPCKPSRLRRVAAALEVR